MRRFGPLAYRRQPGLERQRGELSAIAEELPSAAPISSACAPAARIAAKAAA
jgi:hypothetical protein